MDDCGHQNQTLVLETPDAITYYCADCDVRVWYVPMTILEISAWVGLRKTGFPRIVCDKAEEV